MLPVSNPANNVPIIGEENLRLTIPKNLKIIPSFAIAYIILGRGNIAPNKLEKFYGFLEILNIIRST